MKSNKLRNFQFAKLTSTRHTDRIVQRQGKDLVLLSPGNTDAGDMFSNACEISNLALDVETLTTRQVLKRLKPLMHFDLKDFFKHAKL